MRALNARLDALQKDEEMVAPDRLPPPPPPLEETSPEIPVRQNLLRTAPAKKLPRVPDKKSIFSDLESKLSHGEHQDHKSSAASKFHTAPRPLETKAQ
ncbi:hypothetical protein X975_18736, partial [Stegodyphus mimosarum]